MSQEYTERTRLGPGFDVTGMSGAGAIVYPNEVDMEDTASSSPQIVGEVVPQSTESSLGLALADVPTAESQPGVTGPRTTEMRIQGEADAESASDARSGETISNPGVSGSQVPGDVSGQLKKTASSSRRARPRSPLERMLSPKRTQSSELRARFARLGQAKLLQYMPTPDDVPIAPVPRDTVTRGEADAALAQLQEQISVATLRADDLVHRVEDTRRTAMAAGQIATEGTSGMERTNAGLNAMVVELRNELQAMREQIKNAEKRASDAYRVADVAEQHANRAQYAADAAEQRAVIAQSEADEAKKVQQRLETELQNADKAFRGEKAQREQLGADAHAEITALRQELLATKTKVEKQDTVMKNVTDMGLEMQTARQEMVEQRKEMQEIGEVADGVMEHVEELSVAFKEIDAAQQKEERRRECLVPDFNVKSTSEHVQGTPSTVKEPVGYVQTVPDVVIDLSGGDRKGKGTWKPEPVAEHIERTVEEKMQKFRAALYDEETPEATLSVPPTPTVPTSLMNAANMHETTVHASSSCEAQQFGAENRIPPKYDTEATGARRTVVTKPPSLPSGTQKVIEDLMAAYLKKMGINPESQKSVDFDQTVVGSTARNIPNSGPENTQFSFQRVQDTIAPNPGQQVFATAQWRPKEPPMFTGAVTDDVYLWTSLVKQYFVFMKGDAEQEVAFAATLLRGAAHEWYMGYEKRNGNQPARDWPTLMQAILERFGSNIREQEAHAKLLTISQGKRSVRDYTSEFETLLGRLSTRDESTWKRMFVWGLQPHLGKAVALKYPTSIAQAAGHAEEIELAIRASQRPNLNQSGSRATVSYSARGGSSAVPRPYVQGRGRGNSGPMQRGGRGTGGRRGGGWIRGRQSGAAQTKAGVQCYNCGQYGHYSSQCPKGASTSGSSNTAQSVNQRSNQAQVRGSRGGLRGNRRGGRRTRFAGLDVIYDTEGNEYPVDENGNLVLEFAEEDDADVSHQNQEKSGN